MGGYAFLDNKFSSSAHATNESNHAPIPQFIGSGVCGRYPTLLQDTIRAYKTLETRDEYTEETSINCDVQ